MKATSAQYEREYPNVSNGALAPVGAVAVRGGWRRKLLTFSMIAGPGLIVMVADNDAGAVSTYTEAGAKHGTYLLWLLLLLLPCTYFIQEMVARLGIATGQGQSAMITKRYGRTWGLFSLVDLQVVNFLTLVTEFACIKLATEKMGISPYVAVPVGAAALITAVATASYRRWERVTLVLCALNLTWIVLAFRLGPGFGEVAIRTAVPAIPLGGLTPELAFLVIAIVGTTIAPWQLFFQQSCVADKKLRFADLKWARLDTFIGACAVIFFAACMMLVGNASLHQGFRYDNPAQMAVQLGQPHGTWVSNAVLLLMINAAAVGAMAVSLSSSWAYGEFKGWPNSLQLNVKEAPGFYGVYALCVIAAAGIVLIPGAPLQLIILSVQALAGVILAPAVIFLQMLVNDRQLLGPEFVNRPWNNWVNWAVIGVLMILSLVLAAQFVAPNVFPA